MLIIQTVTLQKDCCGFQNLHKRQNYWLEGGCLSVHKGISSPVTLIVIWLRG